MKLLLLFVLIAACTATSNLPFNLLKLSNLNDQHETNIDPFFDKFIGKVKCWLTNNKKDPLITPEVHENFTKKVGPITWHGSLDLTNGLTKGISHVKRNDKALFGHKNNLFNMRVPITFESLYVKFDYDAKFMSLHRNGVVEASVVDLELRVDAMVDTKSTNLTLREFKISEMGKMKIRFSGRKISDWFLNLILDIVTKVFHKSIQHSLEKDVKELITKEFDDINNWPVTSPVKRMFF